MALGLVGSLLPDLDIFYFYYIDLRQHLHHGYWTHMPLYWFLLFLLSLMAALILKKPGLRSATVVVFSNVCLHLVLDTIVGKVRWLAPFSSRDFVMFDVPAQYTWWIWNFILHWSFLFEVVILAGAGVLFTVSMRKKQLSLEKS